MSALNNYEARNTVVNLIKGSRNLDLMRAQIKIVLTTLARESRKCELRGPSESISTNETFGSHNYSWKIKAEKQTQGQGGGVRVYILCVISTRTVLLMYTGVAYEDKMKNGDVESVYNGLADLMVGMSKVLNDIVSPLSPFLNASRVTLPT